ncbi:MAG TPA: DUF1801 domain-containing protein [Fimbriimonas sp.]|nr:DUF1801 domain-containing protein [Fimbriimonas sp.]
MPVEDPAELVEFLQPYPLEVQELMLEGRRFLLDLLWPVTELFFDATQAVCSGFAYMGGVRESFVNLAAYSDHVTLVFGWGARLDDPEKRLNGSGNQVRHLRLKGMETLEDPYVVGLIRQASANAPKPDGPVEPKQIVKIYNGPKKRPGPR